MKRHNKILGKENTALLVIDIQEKILPVINQVEAVVENTLKLVKGFKVLNLPIFYTEQYPKGLGPTEPKLKEELIDAHYHDKMTFSCSGAVGLFNQFKENNINTIVVCGVETHVCVIQTVLDLLANEFNVYVAADAVSSRLEYNKIIALSRMEKHGAEISVTESILFEILNVCGTDQFKIISKLVK